jgi:secretion/DNA translocation related TadE-like protein
VSRRLASNDAGGATVWVLAAGLLTVLVALGSAAAGAGVVARHRAQSAADLAALAAAARAAEGEEAACGRADEIATVNGAHLVACRLEGFDVTVTAEVTPAGVAAFAGSARASARAGPAEHSGGH